MKRIRNEHRQQTAAPHPTGDFDQLRNDPSLQQLQSVWDSHSRRINHIVANAAPLPSRFAFPVPEPLTHKIRRYAAVALLFLLTASAVPALAAHSQSRKTFIKSNSIDSDTLCKNIQWTIEHIQ